MCVCVCIWIPLCICIILILFTALGKNAAVSLLENFIQKYVLLHMLEIPYAGKTICSRAKVL